MAVKPTAISQNVGKELRGSGNLGRSTDYLKNDPASWYYQKFKDQDNAYVRDDMWSEAAKRGEMAQLIAALQNAAKYESIEAFNKWDSYAQHDYDNYMLSLAIPGLDDTTKKIRKDQETGYEFGEFTDREWALEILKNTFERYDAEQLEENKKNTDFFVKTGAYLGSLTMHLSAGVYNFAQDLFNVGEGVVNMMANWSNDENVGNRFLWAFSNDDGQFLNDVAAACQKAAFEWERKYTSVVDANGYTTWGRWWSAGTESIGYMLPSMLIPVGIFGKGTKAVKAAKAVKQGIFYTGIFSGNINDTVNRATMNGQSYKDLNAGVVVGNAALKAGAQLAIEYALGAVMGFSGLDKMMGVGVKSTTKAVSKGISIATKTLSKGVDAATKVVSKGISVATKTGVKAAGVVLARGAKDMLKEGLEELLQDLSDGLIDYAFDGDFRERGLETLTIQNLVDSFVVGALVSGVTGVVTNASVVLPSNREIGVEANGEVFRMGVFQTLNFRQALETMSQWNDVLHNPKASQQARADAAFKISVAMDTVGSVISAMGMERAIMANQTLMSYLNSDAKKVEAIKQMSDVDYASNLYNNFVEAQKLATAKYVQKHTAEKIKKQSERMAKKLKKKGVTKIENVITDEVDGRNPEIPIEVENVDKLQRVLKGLGAEAMVGVNGHIIEKSGEIVFVDNKLIQVGDVENIIRGIAFEQVQQVVTSQLNPSQKKLLVSQYQKITGTEGTLEQAVTALLFDKNFYTNILLLSGERHYKNAAIEILATIDQIIKSPLTEQLENGKIAEAAYKALMEKVQETMRVGLIVYATNYTRLDLGTVSNEVLPTELKQEIKDHPNVRFSEAIDEGLADKSNTPPINKRIEAYDQMISKFVTQLTEGQITEAKRKARSSNYNDRVDAYTLLTQVARNDKENQNNKLVYLPTEITGEFEAQQIGMLEQFFDADWMDLIDGSFNPNDLTKEAQDYIIAGGYNMADKQSRLACLREVLFAKSGESLTIGNDGAILKVLPKSEFLKAEYLTTDGDRKLRQAIIDGKVKTLADIAVIELPIELGSIKLVISDKLGSANGSYIDGGSIALSGRQTTSAVMHETTHVTQYLTNVGIEDIAGGNTGAFTVLPQKIITDIDNYLEKTFPLTYEYMTEHKVTTPQLIYFMLSGELQANSTLTSHMFEIGFRFKNNRQELVSPDGSRTWSLKPGVQEGTDALMRKLKKKTARKSTETNETDAKREDRPLMSDEIQELRNDKETEKFLKGSAFVRKDGSPMVFYRGSKMADGQLHGDGIFLSTKPYVASMYANPNTGALRGYVVNIPRSEIAVIDAKGSSFDAIMLKGRAWSTDELVNYVRQVHPEMKGLFIKNVIEDFGENQSKPGSNLIVFDTNTLRRATTEDNNRFQQQWREKMDTLNPEITSNPDTASRPGATTYEAEFKKFAEDYAKRDASFSEGFGDEDRRYISNKVAKESNLKYWIQKGRPIQMDPGVAAFVIATTKDFNKLPVVLRKKIENAALNKYDIIDYVSTASRINDYTFQMIAEHVFHNSELAQITYKDMRLLMDHIEELGAISVLVDEKLEKLTPAELITKLREVQKKVDTDPEFAKKYLKAIKRAETVKLYDTNGASFVEAHADTKQLNSVFFRHYDGTLASLRTINNLGKYMTAMQTELELKENQDTGALETGSKKAWNWVDNMKKAEIDYEIDDVAHSLDSIPYDDKLQAIKDYITNELARRVESMSKEEIAKMGKAILIRRAQEFKKLEGLSEEQINRRYLIAIGAESLPNEKRKLEPVLDAKGNPVGPTTDKNRKDHLYNLSRTIRTRIAGLKTRYNSLPVEVKKYIDPENGYRIRPEYRKLSSAELDTLIQQFSEASKTLRAQLSKSQRAEKLRRDTQRRLEHGKRADYKPNDQINTNPDAKKTMRQKVQVEYRTKIKSQEFEFISPEKPNTVVTRMLDTAWNTQRMSTVKGVTNNVEQDVANAKTFFQENAQHIMEATINEIEAAARFFLDSKMNNGLDAEVRKFQAIKMYFLGYVFGETGKGKLFANLNPNLKTRIEAALKAEATNAGTMLSIWQNIQGLLDPTDAMAQASMEIDGVELTYDEKIQLFEAAQSGDIARIEDIQNHIINRVAGETDKKKSIWRKITTFRSMAMLSSPITWLRNVVSNMAVKRLNKLASAIGSKLWTGKTVEGQWKMNMAVTPEIQAFISKHFLDNKLFDTLVSNLSKYNPSEISSKFKDATGKASKEAIFAQMVIKSMYNKYYNENLFKTKWMNDLHNKLMHVMSDNSYVREAAVRYFGKMIAEKGYDLSTDTVSDAIMNDFGSAIGLALADYMHSDNIFNYIETKISETSELGLFAYKTLLPFASASYQWFKAALRLSPLGLARAIFNMATLEKRVINAEAKWAQGKSQIDPHLTEYLARRDLGQGVIGTIGWALGMMLAGFGVIGLEDDDYGTPKLRIGNLRIDISSIFGSSSLLAGAALIVGMQDKGMTWDGFLEGLNRMADVTIDGFPLLQIVEMDMFSNGTFSMGLNQLESIALSFIPNIISWFAGATYSGKLDKKNLWGKAAAKIPFLGAVVNEKKVDPYTGAEGSWWDAFNRFVPYLSIEVASQNEKNSKELGLNKSQLKGEYTINDQTFKLSAKETTEINKMYGQWNAESLELFYKNQMKVRIKVGNTYKTLSYNQMDDVQRKTAVQQIMQKNATYAKIRAWTKAGNKYYASADEYAALRRLGITSNVYRGTKGFVSK